MERLEYYIHRLRDCIYAKDRFYIWDWAMAYRLNQEEIEGLIYLAKEFEQTMREQTDPSVYPPLEELRSRMKGIVYTGQREHYIVNVTDEFIAQFLKNLKRMGPFRTFTRHYLTEIKEREKKGTLK